MKRTREQKGITLIALIITIVVLLILASVAINSITNDGIIDKAQEVADTYELAQEKENLQKEILQWQLIYSNGTPTLETYLVGIYGEENVQLNADNSITVTVPSGNRYIVKENGSVTLFDGTVEEPEAVTISVSLDKTEITKEITSGSTATETLTATLVNGEGTLSWTSTDTNVAEVVENGNTATVTLKAAGTATITVTYADNTDIKATCTVTVTEKQNEIITNKLNGAQITIDSTNTSYTYTYEFGDKTLASTELTVLEGDLLTTSGSAVWVDGADRHSIFANGAVLDFVQAAWSPTLAAGTVSVGTIQITFVFSDGTTDTDTFKLHHTAGE